MTDPLILSLPVDINLTIATYLKECRIKRGITYQELSSASNINVQQIKKYENASVPLVSSVLYLFAKLLRAPLEYFLEQLDFQASAEYWLNPQQDHYYLPNLVEEDAAEYLGQSKFDEISPGLNKEVLSLVKVFIEIQNPLIRQKIIELIKAIIFNGANYHDMNLI